MRKFILIMAFVFIVLLVVVGMMFALKLKGGVKLVQTDVVRRRTIESSVIAFGRVEPKSDVNISAEVSERIERILVEEGDTVKVGDLLVELNRDRLAAAVNRALAQVHQVEANLNRARDNLAKTEKLHSEGVVSDDALLSAQTEVAVLEAQLESANAALNEARDNLAQTIIRSPLDGIVTSIQAEKGEFVIVGTMNNPGSVIMTIAQLTDMQARVDVDEADVVDVCPGQRARIELDAIPDTFFNGTVVQVAHQAKVQSVGGQETRASFDVKIAIENPSPKIRPGMSVTATIITAKHDSTVSIPLSAVVAYHDTLTNREGEGVFVVRDGIARKVRIKTGISDDRFIEVLDGVSEGDVVVSGPFNVLRGLSDGDRVRPIERGGKKRGQFPKGAQGMKRKDK